MNDCCNTATRPDYPKKAVCPLNGQSYQRVERKTLLHHLLKPWQLDLPEQAYYFCDSPDCDVVYFGQDTQTFTQAELRTRVGQKSNQADRTLCYCFDVKQNDLLERFGVARNFVVNQTLNGTCDCEIRNPSGRCCLKDFPKTRND